METHCTCNCGCNIALREGEVDTCEYCDIGAHVESINDYYDS